MAMQLSEALPALWSDENSGDGARTLANWIAHERPRIVHLYEEHVFGRTPDGGSLAGVTLRDVRHGCVGGTASRYDYVLTVAGPMGSRKVGMHLYVPREFVEAGRAAPAFLGLNFRGNLAVRTEDDFVAGAAVSETSPEESPGIEYRRLPVDRIIERGYAVATIHCADLEVDAAGNGPLGVRGLFDDRDTIESNLLDPASAQWGAIGAWAWGLSRALDALEQIPLVDAGRVLVWGHSRLGKTALWAAAQDARFAGAISNNSGCAGASLFRHESGENIQQICDTFGYWFSPVFGSYRGRESELPVDQHMLLAAVLPASVHVASARADAHADPIGEHASCALAGSLADMCATDGSSAAPELAAQAVSRVLESGEIPSNGTWGGGLMSYRCREGAHPMTQEDWSYFLSVADSVLSGGPAGGSAPYTHES